MFSETLKKGYYMNLDTEAVLLYFYYYVFQLLLFLLKAGIKYKYGLRLQYDFS